MDIDDELQLLQRELMAVQEEKTNPLSERTVAEIMVKLHHEGFSFIPTTDGNQYVTPQRVEEEVVSLVRERGKVGLSIIPQLLNVGAEVVEGRLNQIMPRWSITRHGGNLFSEKYFQVMMVGLEQQLQEEGRIDLQQMAMEHQLKMQFAMNLISANLHRLGAELDGRQLVTRQYTLLQKAKILGFLSAVHKPLQVEVLYKMLLTEVKNAQGLICELIQEGKVRGRFTSGYFVPDSFTANQKRIVNRFVDNNGYLDLEMLRKKFMISRPQEWVEKNMENSFVKIDQFYFREDKLDSLATQLNSFLRAEGFVELASVLPLEFSESELQQFLQGRCALKEYFLCEGYCYSNGWLQRLTDQFKHRVIQAIFFKKPEGKGKEGKKKGKKQKVEMVSEEELRETLFNGGYADYTMAEAMAPELVQLLLSRLQDLRKKLEKDLAHSKGIISSTFLKYKSCRSILRSEQGLTRAANVIQKQVKKGEKWVDLDFGPNETQTNGIYSVIYYDNVLPKGWAGLQSLKWREMGVGELLATGDKQGRNWPMKKCLLVSLCELLVFHNSKGFQLPTPEMQPLQEQSQAPYFYRFFISQKQKRFVMVDNLLPFVEQKPLGSLGRFSLAEKAYAKFRYCYKGILGVGVSQMLLELTGRNCLRYGAERGKEREVMMQKLGVHLQRGDFVVVLGEGEGDRRLRLGEDELQLWALCPYYLSGSPQELRLFPSVQMLPLKAVAQLFVNIFVIPKEVVQS